MRVLRWLDENLEKCLLLIFLIVMVFALTLQIIFRFVLNTPLSWSEELARYMFVWSGFISISYCLKTNIAIRIDQVVNFLPGKGRLMMNLQAPIALVYVSPFLGYILSMIRLIQNLIKDIRALFAKDTGKE